MPRVSHDFTAKWIKGEEKCSADISLDSDDVVDGLIKPFQRHK